VGGVRITGEGSTASTTSHDVGGVRITGEGSTASTTSHDVGGVRITGEGSTASTTSHDVGGVHIISPSPAISVIDGIWDDDDQFSTSIFDVDVVPIEIMVDDEYSAWSVCPNRAAFSLAPSYAIPSMRVMMESLNAPKAPIARHYF
jgi:hypothetical protein